MLSRRDMGLPASTASRAAPPSMLSLSYTADAPQTVVGIMSWHYTSKLVACSPSPPSVRVGVLVLLSFCILPASGTGTYTYARGRKWIWSGGRAYPRTRERG